MNATYACPDPLARAPRACTEKPPHDKLYLAPPALQGALVALISRDTRHADLSSPQRLTHFPASPLLTLSWFHDMTVGKVVQNPGGPLWQPFGTDLVVAGSQSRPLVSWAPNTGRGYTACFTADGARALFGLDLTTIHDRFLPASTLPGTDWAALEAALLAAGDDAAALAVLVQQLGPRWQAVQGRSTAQPSLRQVGRHWVERLAWQAHRWRSSHSQRQVERRIKSFSGRSLRQWQALTRTEGLFFAARERHASGQPLDWADIALEEGFADQSHMSREAKRITGFAPGEFARRFLEDESFWLYRLWV